MIPLPQSVETTGQLTTFDRKSKQKTIPLAPGQTQVIGTVEGSGYLARIWLTFPGWFWAHWEPKRPVNQRIMKALILKVYADNEKHPQLAAPVADLCGVGLGQAANFAANRLGMSSGGFYLAFPMPFKHQLRIEVENVDPEIETNLFANALYQLVKQLPADTPYFHGMFNSGRCSGGDDLAIAHVRGAGKYVGCTLSCQSESRNNLSFLEAPEYIFTDDQDEANQIVGTGMEDYFLGGWYFREGPFTGSHHGVTIKDALNSSVAMYRIHEEDPVWFQSKFEMCFRPTWDPERLPSHAWSSVAYLYLSSPQPAPRIPSAQELWSWYRVRSTDHQAIP